VVGGWPTPLVRWGRLAGAAGVGDIAGVETVDISKTRAAVRVVIAEGGRLARAGLRALLENRDGFIVVAEAATADMAVAEAMDARPDVVLVGAGLDGVETTQRILAATETGVVLLMSAAVDEDAFAALRVGVRGLVLGDAEPGALAEAVRVVGRGGTLLAPAFASRLVADFLSRPERLRSTPTQLGELTAREREVVELVACGLSNDEIAERLTVTRATAKTHVSRALFKLRARDRAQLVVLAYECGLVWPAPRPRLHSVAA
jgi:DNA-binding NarL/FixJ family response regulator